MISAPDGVKRILENTVQFFIAAAPLPEKLLADMKVAGFDVTHLYGQTETCGPALVNDELVGLSDLPPVEQATFSVRHLPLEGLGVLDPEAMAPVPHDGKTMSDVMV